MTGFVGIVILALIVSIAADARVLNALICMGRNIWRGVRGH